MGAKPQLLVANVLDSWYLQIFRLFNLQEKRYKIRNYLRQRVSCRDYLRWQDMYWYPLRRKRWIRRSDQCTWHSFRSWIIWWYPRARFPFNFRKQNANLHLVPCSSRLIREGIIFFLFDLGRRKGRLLVDFRGCWHVSCNHTFQILRFDCGKLLDDQPRCC